MSNWVHLPAVEHGVKCFTCISSSQRPCEIVLLSLFCRGSNRLSGLIKFTQWKRQRAYERSKALWGKTPASMTFPEFQRVDLEELLIKGEATKRPHKARLKGSEKLIKIRRMGLPWWYSGWESACQCRGHGFEPWSGKIPHAAEQLGPWAKTTEPARLEPVLRNRRGRDSEWPPLAATRESPRTETKTQHSHK